MTKKRKYSSATPVKIEVKEENTANGYLMAKSHLNGVLKQLVERSESDESDSSDDQYRGRYRNDRKRKAPLAVTPFQHTYVMKLFDRSVDLARFEEDTPLYPICRAWMENQPRNSQAIIKRRYSSPEPDNHSWNEDGSMMNLSKLPPPVGSFITRVPSPLPEQKQDKDNINLNYEECPPIEKNVLIRNHLERWVQVKKKWLKLSAKNDDRYTRSTNLLQTIYNKAQENME